MRDDMHAVPPEHGHHPALSDKRHPRAYPLEERAWRRPEQNGASLAQEITISRWLDLRTASRTEEAVTPSDRYFIGVASRTTRIKLTGEQRTIFEGVMPESTLYVSAPSKRLVARFDAPCDFLHFHVPDSYFTDRLPIAQHRPTQHLNDLILLRDMFAGQLTRPLLGRGEPIDETFARCIGQTLAMRLARLEFPRTKVGALANWRLRRVQDHVKQNFRRSIRLPELARVAGLSRMHFAAQFRAATGYRPHEYLLAQRVEHAKTLLNTEAPLVQVALAVGFCTQAHFSTVFKGITGETPADWRARSSSRAASGPV
ncbi:AraC family transcriptional regulator [Bradyrhizobium sp. LVM 105]|uniref:AraC family transcriptional regulator n=1 Tax=Bradyrhizobium sp. LVM 105 TaxID=2341115 RepID=UPI0013E0096E|nr:AraC family transcriptional regulator [Bradyrhizobium sp. LVM 105]